MTTERDADFDGWYVQAYPRVRAAVTLALGDADLAEDATAEAFARALVHWSKVRSRDVVARLGLHGRDEPGAVHAAATWRRAAVAAQAGSKPVAHQAPPVEPDDPLWRAVGQLAQGTHRGGSWLRRRSLRGRGR